MRNRSERARRHEQQNEHERILLNNCYRIIRSNKSASNKALDEKEYDRALSLFDDEVRYRKIADLIYAKDYVGLLEMDICPMDLAPVFTTDCLNFGIKLTDEDCAKCWEMSCMKGKLLKLDKGERE